MTSRLFQTLRVGAMDLPNRIVMAPMGRARCHGPDRSPTESVALYYRQRASAGLIVAEATHVAQDSFSRIGASSLYSEVQAWAWRRSTDAVHAAGGRIVIQLMHVGRRSHPALMSPGRWPCAPSPVAARGVTQTPDGLQPFPVPEPMSQEDIRHMVGTFARSAALAKLAGFDGIEVHAAHGFLLDQFLRSSSNRRTDPYGGSIADRCRLTLEVVDSMCGVVGPERVGLRISPHFTEDGIGDELPQALFCHLAYQLSARGVAYLHLVEPSLTRADQRLLPLLRRAFSGVLIACGGYDAESANGVICAGLADAIAFGVPFIANPDLVERIRDGLPWALGYRHSFGSGGDEGYIDYPRYHHGPSPGTARG